MIFEDLEEKDDSLADLMTEVFVEQPGYKGSFNKRVVVIVMVVVVY